VLSDVHDVPKRIPVMRMKCEKPIPIADTRHASLIEVCHRLDFAGWLVGGIV
jgi:hypothetical protein